MKFLIDAQLPRRLAYWIRDAGFDAVPTLDLPDGYRTTDAELISVADTRNRILVTKDSDFVNSFTVTRRPAMLLLISTGNIANADLETLIEINLGTIVTAFSASRFVELTRTSLVIHV